MTSLDLSSAASAACKDHSFLSIQCDWEQVVREQLPSDTTATPDASSTDTTSRSSLPRPPTFWLSSTDAQHHTIEGKCNVVPSTEPTTTLPTVSPSSDFTTTLLSPLLLSVSCPATSASYTIQAPSLTLLPAALSHPADSSFTSVAFSPTTPAHLLTGSTSGTLTLATLSSATSSSAATTSATSTVSFEGHVGDVDIATFFPSGQVLLSAALDLTLRVWAIATQQCALTLTGHSQRITAVELIDRGRQFVSSSRDGTVRLWDCSAARSVAVYGSQTGTNRTVEGAVNDVLLLREGSHPLALSSKGGSGAGLQDAYEGWMVLAACEDGYVRGYDMRVPSSSSAVLSIRLPAPVLSLTQPAPHTLLASAANGLLSLVDLRQLVHIVQWRREVDVAVQHVAAEGSGYVWTADELGVVSRWRLGDGAGAAGGGEVVVERELSGVDMQPVRGWSFDRQSDGAVKRVATAIDAVRLYDIQ